jgi:hypothetical protein
MAEGQSKAYEAYFEAAQKFDYFVTGGAGTALTYAVQTYRPISHEAFHLLVPVAWLSLLTAVGAGLWHLSMRVDHARMSVANMGIGEDLTTLREAHLTGAGVYMTGPDIMVRPQQMQDAIQMHASELENIQEALSKLNTRGKWIVIVRNAFLFIGLATLTAWKILNLP